MIRLGGLGDLLVALPAMECLRRAMPGRRRTLLCRGEYGDLFVDAGIADDVIPLESRAASAFFGERAALPTGPARSFSLAVGWMQNQSPSAIEDSLGVLGIPAVLFSPSKRPTVEPLSRRFFADTLSAFRAPGGAVPDFEECSHLHSEKGGRAAARAALGKGMPGGGRFAVIHPGSGGTGKLWPLENFLEIARRLRETGIPGVLVTGETEECPAIAGRLERESLPSGWSWMRRPPLLGLAGLLAEGPLYLGNDSGVTHLAAACGASVTALFLQTNIPAWEPFGRSRVLAASVLSDLDTETVWTNLLGRSDIL